MIGWQCHLHEGPTEWMRDVVALTIFRRLAAGNGEQIVGWDESGNWVTVPIRAGAQLRPGLPIPREAISSLTEQLRPGPSERELAQLQAALDIERGRFDRLVDRLATPPVPAVLETFAGDETRQGVELLDRDAVRDVARRLRELDGRIKAGLASQWAKDIELAEVAAELDQLAGPA